ncbi:MAG: hypothetical protein ACLFRP_07660 [Puniceicoccaceae bacterium]
MNREEAKAVLRAWRTGMGPEDEPLAREALDRLKTDRVLAEWFEAEKAFDRRVEGALEAMPVPRGLRGRILAAAPPKDSGEQADTGKVRRFPVVLSLAASLAALIFVGILVFDPSAAEAEADLDGFYDHVLETADMPADPGTESDDFGELRRYLTDRGAVVPDILPGELDPLSPTGARVTEWIDRVVGVVHLRDDGGEGYRLFLLPSTAVPEASELPDKPAPRRLRGYSMLIWTEDGILYALATEGSEADLLPFAGE